MFVCVIYIISLLQKFTLIVGTIFGTSVSPLYAVSDNFFVVVESCVCSLFPHIVILVLILISIAIPSPSMSLFKRSTAHFTISGFGNMCAFPFVCFSRSVSLFVCPLVSLACFIILILVLPL